MNLSYIPSHTLGTIYNSSLFITCLSSVKHSCCLLFFSCFFLSASSRWWSKHHQSWKRLPSFSFHPHVLPWLEQAKILTNLATKVHSVADHAEHTRGRLLIRIFKNSFGLVSCTFLGCSARNAVSVEHQVVLKRLSYCLLTFRPPVSTGNFSQHHHPAIHNSQYLAGR